MNQSNYCNVCKSTFKSVKNLTKHYETKTHKSKITAEIIATEQLDLSDTITIPLLSESEEEQQEQLEPAGVDLLSYSCINDIHYLLESSHSNQDYKQLIHNLLNSKKEHFTDNDVEFYSNDADTNDDNEQLRQDVIDLINSIES
jgi:hypothetical protein